MRDTHRPGVIHNHVKLHEDIGYLVLARTRMFGKNNQRGIIWKLRKGEQSVLCETHHPDLICFLIKLHQENIPI